MLRVIFTGLPLILLPVSAFAQQEIVTLTGNLPADKYHIGEGGVDLRTGRYIYSETDIKTGEKIEGGIELTRTNPDYTANHANPFENFSHNWDIRIVEMRRGLQANERYGSDFRLNVHHSGRSFTFDAYQNSPTTVTNQSGPIERITLSGATNKADANAIWTYESSDGTIIKFRPMGSFDCGAGMWGIHARRCAYASEMIEPNGTRFLFDYDYNGGVAGNRARLRRVTSSTGFALVLEGSGTRVTKACAFNLAKHTPPADNSCGSAVPSATYAYANALSNNVWTAKLSTATRPDGGQWQFTYSGNREGYLRPSDSAAWLVNTISYVADEEEGVHEVVDRQDYSSGQTYVYGYQYTPYSENVDIPKIVGGWYSAAQNNGASVEYGFEILPGTGINALVNCPNKPCQLPMPEMTFRTTYQTTSGPISVVDPLGGVTRYEYCDPVAMANLPIIYLDRCFLLPNPVHVIDPSGRKILFEYDSSRNVTKLTTHPAPGSSDPIQVQTATYNTSQPKFQTKPLSVTDARGNVTTYSYAPEHGGVLTEVKPAVAVQQADGSVVNVQPVKRFSYGQFYAWTKSGGGYVQAATPVWLLSQERTCRKTATVNGACAGGAADEVVTSYEYQAGNASTPSNLLLKGVAVTADGTTLRTCYGYDEWGRRISETKPQANLTSCPQ